MIFLDNPEWILQRTHKSSLKNWKRFAKSNVLWFSNSVWVSLCLCPVCIIFIHINRKNCPTECLNELWALDIWYIFSFVNKIRKKFHFDESGWHWIFNFERNETEYLWYIIWRFSQHKVSLEKKLILCVLNVVSYDHKKKTIHSSGLRLTFRWKSTIAVPRERLFARTTFLFFYKKSNSTSILVLKLIFPITNVHAMVLHHDWYLYITINLILKKIYNKNNDYFDSRP